MRASWSYAGPVTYENTSTWMDPFFPMYHYEAYTGGASAPPQYGGDWQTEMDDPSTQLMFVATALWFLLLVLAACLGLLRQYCHERPVEDRRTQEIDELIADGQHAWSSEDAAAAAREGTSSTDGPTNECTLCMEPYEEGEMVLKLPWCAARASGTACSHDAIDPHAHVRAPLLGPHAHALRVLLRFAAATRTTRNASSCGSSRLHTRSARARTAARTRSSATPSSSRHTLMTWRRRCGPLPRARAPP